MKFSNNVTENKKTKDCISSDNRDLNEKTQIVQEKETDKTFKHE